MRILSDANVYHIVLKGINSEQIFFDEDDYLSFMNVLKVSCSNYNALLYAFCIMNNHVHLLIKFNENNMPQMFKSFGASFVFRYNKKYNRSGSLFNGRYFSKAINDDAGYCSHCNSNCTNGCRDGCHRGCGNNCYVNCEGYTHKYHPACPTCQHNCAGCQGQCNGTCRGTCSRTSYTVS